MKTEIYGTLGPSCASSEILEQMLRLGMTGVRLNLSHVTLREASPMVEALRTAGERCGCRPRLLVDMQGPELRVSSLPDPVWLEEGSETPLSFLSSLIRERLERGQEILLDDGRLLLQALSADRAKVVRGGVLQSRKSVALPGLEIRLPALTDSDLENIACAKEYGVTGVMQPFVRSREDLQAVRAALDAAGCTSVRLFAKIENREGLRHLPELIDAADEIVIARGDLGNAMPLWELPRVQMEIARLCREAGRPFMVVTQMLTSMEHSPVPTRAEVNDVFRAVLDGAASVMVTGETAVGDYPAEVIRYLVNTAREAEAFLQ